MSKKHKRILWLSVVLIILALPAVVWVSARTTLRESLTAKGGKQRIEGEIIGVTPHGFEPKEIVRPAGPFLLVIDNRSGVAVINLLLSRDVGLPIRSALLPHERRLWSDIVDLSPGSYTLREPTHPDWVCHITIQ